jgi:hypothetical protein
MLTIYYERNTAQLVQCMQRTYVRAEKAARLVTDGSCMMHPCMALETCVSVGYVCSLLLRGLNRAGRPDRSAEHPSGKRLTEKYHLARSTHQIRRCYRFTMLSVSGRVARESRHQQRSSSQLVSHRRLRSAPCSSPLLHCRCSRREIPPIIVYYQKPMELAVI